MSRSKVRIFINDKIELSKNYLVQGNLFRYLTAVMRKKVHDSILVFNGRDGEWEATIVSINKKDLQITYFKQTREQTYSKRKISLAFAPIKHDNNSIIIQKATEIGVDEILPILTERTIIRELNLEKLKLVAIEAAEQSERINIPDIKPIINLYDLALEKFGIVIFCNEKEKQHYILNIVKDLKNFYDILIVVGPEGGFSDSERAWIESFANIRSVCLNDLILRSETAIISTLAIVKAALL